MKQLLQIFFLGFALISNNILAQKEEYTQTISKKLYISALTGATISLYLFSSIILHNSIFDNVFNFRLAPFTAQIFLDLLIMTACIAALLEKNLAKLNYVY